MYLNFFLQNKQTNAAKNNFYLDYILKKSAQYCLKNVFIALHLFVFEKYFIEYWFRFWFYNFINIKINFDKKLFILVSIIFINLFLIILIILCETI